MSKNKFLADLVMVIHVLWAVFMILSIPIVLIYPESGPYILAFPVLMIILWFLYGGCFATDLEKYFRRKHHPDHSYKGPFIKHYLKKFFNLETSDHAVNIVSYSLVLILGLIVMFS